MEVTRARSRSDSAAMPRGLSAAHASSIRPAMTLTASADSLSVGSAPTSASRSIAATWRGMLSEVSSSHEPADMRAPAATSATWAAAPVARRAAAQQKTTSNRCGYAEHEALVALHLPSLQTACANWGLPPAYR